VFPGTIAMKRSSRTEHNDVVLLLEVELSRRHIYDSNKSCQFDQTANES